MLFLIEEILVYIDRISEQKINEALLHDLRLVGKLLIKNYLHAVLKGRENKEGYWHNCDDLKNMEDGIVIAMKKFIPSSYDRSTSIQKTSIQKLITDYFKPRSVKTSSTEEQSSEGQSSEGQSSEGQSHEM